jgi:hypothetical protein
MDGSRSFVAASRPACLRGVRGELISTRTALGAQLLDMLGKLHKAGKDEAFAVALSGCCRSLIITFLQSCYLINSIFFSDTRINNFYQHY